MSRFTGKCDLYDSIEMMDGGYKQFIARHSRGVIIDVDGEQFEVKSRDDILPYYTRLVGVWCGQKDGKLYIRLSSKPYTRTMIEERKEWISRYKRNIRRWSKNPDYKNNKSKIAWAQKEIACVEESIKIIERWEDEFADYVKRNLGHDNEV